MWQDALWPPVPRELTLWLRDGKKDYPVHNLMIVRHQTNRETNGWVRFMVTGPRLKFRHNPLLQALHRCNMVIDPQEGDELMIGRKEIIYEDTVNGNHLATQGLMGVNFTAFDSRGYHST